MILLSSLFLGEGIALGLYAIKVINCKMILYFEWGDYIMRLPKTLNLTRAYEKARESVNACRVD